MSDDFTVDEICAVCGRDARGQHGYCRIYQGTGRVALCRPECAEKFLRGSASGANGCADQDFIGSLIEELRWTHWCL